MAPGHAEAGERVWALVRPYPEKHVTNPFGLVELADRYAGETPARTRQGAFERLMAAPAAA